MITTVKITTIEEAERFLFEYKHDEKIGRLRSDYLYRGIVDSSFKLATSLKRNCKELQKSLEPSILRYFTKYGVIEDPQIEKSVWRQMIMGQHYGLPTRLLDWSHSSLIALHFALAEPDVANTGTRDAVVWRIDSKELAALLPDNYRSALDKERTDVFSIDSLTSIVPSLEQYDEDMGSKSMAIVEPPSSDQRIVNQYAYFSVIPLEMDDIEGFLDKNTENTVRYVIDKSLCWDLRDILDQMNISERIVFPGLDGLSKWIARHYYVK